MFVSFFPPRIRLGNSQLRADPTRAETQRARGDVLWWVYLHTACNCYVVYSSPCRLCQEKAQLRADVGWWVICCVTWHVCCCHTESVSRWRGLEKKEHMMWHVCSSPLAHRLRHSAQRLRPRGLRPKANNTLGMLLGEFIPCVSLHVSYWRAVSVTIHVVCLLTTLIISMVVLPTCMCTPPPMDQFQQSWYQHSPAHIFYGCLSACLCLLQCMFLWLPQTLFCFIFLLPVRMWLYGGILSKAVG